MKEKNCLKCPICSSKNIIFLKKVNNIKLYKCKDCRIIWAPEELNHINPKEFYNENYYENSSNQGYENYLKDEANHRLNAKNILNTINKIRKLENINILDIGSAYGFLLDETRKNSLNCNIYGIEISKCAYDYACSNLGLNVLNEEFNGHNFGETKFDIVFLTGTIEHLQNPAIMLENISKVLNKDGLLLITTIDTGGLLPLYHLKPPEHLFYFNRLNIEKIALLYNLKIIFTKMHFASYFVYDLFSRLGKFFKIPIIEQILKALAVIFRKYFTNSSIIIPTNEMLVIFKYQD